MVDLSLFGVAGKTDELVELPNSKGLKASAGWVVGKQQVG